MNNDVYKKLIAHITALIKKSIFITEENSNKQDARYNKYSHFVLGIELEGNSYTVHIVLGENAGIWYYDHMVSKIEKGKLLSVIQVTNSGHPVVSLSNIKDTTLLRILQAPLHEKNIKGDSND